MELKIIGTIKVIGELQTFDSGFSKVEFVLTTDEQYPQDIKFEAVKEKADKFLQYNKVGDRIEVKFNVRGNEYNGKYYNTLQAWYTQNVESNEADGTTSRKTLSEVGSTEEEINDLPF